MQREDDIGFERVEDIEDLERIIDRSHDQPVVLFNHDPWCPISARAFREMARRAEGAAIVDVSTQRDVTREIVARTGVRHESPQVIVVKDGKARWAASHYQISAEGVDAAVTANTSV